jgi:hypothetical protein
MKTNLIISVVVIFLLSLVTGCYTILFHPDVETTDENGYTYNNDVKFYDDCSSCHKDVPHSYVESPQILKAHPLYSNFGYFDYNNYYYNDSYYGNYGYYYNYPWWLDITPPTNNNKSEQYTGGARNNSSERGEAARERPRNIDLPSPTVSPGNTGTTGTGTSTSTSSGTSTETRSTNSNSNASGRNSSSTSGARNNNGDRSSDTGRKK